ncbi:MAG: nucleoside phosphorylase-I family protein [Vulcanimicrobiaceae bacterium]
MATSIDCKALTVVAATRMEARAVRRALPSARVLRTGVALSRANGTECGDLVISCGVAGGLLTSVATGTVLVPAWVRRPNGEMLRCDPELAALLEAAARRLGFEPLSHPLVTSAALVRGSARALWAARGYAGADMETGLLEASRVASVRVVLDTPSRELSEDWLHPTAALLRPHNWPQALWLAREAPRCARAAADVLRVAFG